MPEPDWAKLLSAYYQHGGWMWKITHTGDEFPHLSKKNNISVHLPENDMDRSLDAQNALLRFGLVELVSFSDVSPRRGTPSDDVQWTKMTKKGFDVAHERQMVHRQDDTNKQAAKTSKRVAELTVILAAAGIVQALASLFSANYVTDTILAGGIGVTIISAIVIFAYLIFG